MCEVTAISITTHFASLPDPRRACNALTHNLVDVFVIALCATICGAENFTEIAEFGRSKLGWLRDRLGLELKDGIPSHDTFGRIFSMLDPEAFASCFARWT